MSARQGQTKICTCGKSRKTYDGIDLKLAGLLWILVPILCGVFVQSMWAVVVVGLILIGIYSIFVGVNKIRGHSLRCALRKAFLEMDEFMSMTSSIG